jgi:CheY-like chemotaxis protein
VDLGLERSAIAAVLRGSLAQRLIRRLCADCAIPVTTPLTAAEQRLAAQFGVQPKFRAAGCATCGNSGYRGRLPLDEVAVITPSLGEQIASGGTALQLQRAAIAQGMRSLRDGAVERVRDGETTLEEMERVLGEAADEAAAAVEAPPSSPTSPTSPPTVLLTDDDAMLRYLAASILESGGYRVLQAKDGAEALELLAAGPDVSLLVTDLQMPGMSGEELVKRLRARSDTSLLPVIVLTGTDEYETEARLMDAGADDYIRKPIDPPRFLARVKAALRRAGVS